MTIEERAREIEKELGRHAFPGFNASRCNCGHLLAHNEPGDAHIALAIARLWEEPDES